MSLASLFGGLALANAGLGAVHGLAAPLGGMFHAPHGAVCAALLPHVMAANLRAMRGGGAHSPGRSHAPTKSVACCSAGLTPRPTPPSPGSAASSNVWASRAWASSAWSAADLPAIAEQAQRSSSMKGNPVALGADQLIAVLTAAL